MAQTMKKGCDLQDSLGVHSIGRYRPLLMWSQLALFFVGVFFWVGVSRGAATFTPETWGHFAYSLPAQAWAFWNMAASAITFIGIKRPTRRRMVVVGGLMNCVQFAALAYSAAFTGGDPAVSLYASIYFLPLHIWLVWEAWHHG